MALRCCEEALRLRNDHADAIALWLASNIRREARLGMNVESGDASETGEKDGTRPTVFPRALYFSQAAGSLYSQLVLERAVRDRDSAVALGAIEALRHTAGESSLFGFENGAPPLASALEFPDLVVRIRAALALGAALPKTEFAGAPLVVPVLATALTLDARERVIVVDPDPASLNRVVAALRTGGRDVIGETNLYRALERARVELQGQSGIFLATDVRDPDFAAGVKSIRGEFTFAKTPIVALAGSRSDAATEAVLKTDAGVEAVDSAADANLLVAALEKARARTRQSGLDSQLALSMSLQAADVLRQIALDGKTVLRFEAAESALIAAMDSTNENLRTLSASVLARVRTPTAQRAIAYVALDAKHTKSLRIAVFGSLAESGMANGLQLEESQIRELVRMAREEPDLALRTAASKALGALNLRTNQASEIIRSYYGG
jgi:CheY-like chemotaxis protein